MRGIVYTVLLAACLSGCYDGKAAHTAIEQGIAACKAQGGKPSTFVSALVARVDCDAESMTHPRSMTQRDPATPREK